MLFSGFSIFYPVHVSSDSFKQAVNPAFLPFLGTRRRHHKPPLRGGQVRYRARAADADPCGRSVQSGRHRRRAPFGKSRVIRSSERAGKDLFYSFQNRANTW